MYSFSKTLLFLLDPERAHDLTLKSLKWAPLCRGRCCANAAGLSGAPIEQQQNWLIYGNVDGLPAGIIDSKDIQNYIESNSGLNYLNNPNDPVATFIGFNFGQTNQYNDSQSASYLQGATEGNVMQSVLEIYSLLTTSNSAHSRYRWNNPSTWPTQAVMANHSTIPTVQSNAEITEGQL